MIRSIHVRGLGARLRSSPALNLVDQVLSSGTNFLATVVVARSGTPRQFGEFSIVLITFFVLAGFNRSVPHTIAMTLEWDDERSRSGYFFLPPLAAGITVTPVLIATFVVVDHSWLPVPLFLLPLLLQDAVRMHAFALHKPHVAVLSDAVWLLTEAVGFVFVSASASGAAAVWGIGALCGLLVTRPWRIRLRIQRRPVRADAVSAALEYATFAGLGYLTPVLAIPIITVLGVGALQGANVIRGPLLLLIQGLIVHRIAGSPISPDACVREAVRLSVTILAVTLASILPLFAFRNIYGPRVLGATWPQVEPLVIPALLTLVMASSALGPVTAVRKMGRFIYSAKVQTSLAPLFAVLPLLGAAADGTQGFLYGTTLAYAVSGMTWWILLPKLQKAISLRKRPSEQGCSTPR